MERSQHSTIKVMRESIDSNSDFSFGLVHPECKRKIMTALHTSKKQQTMLQ